MPRTKPTAKLFAALILLLFLALWIGIRLHRQHMVLSVPTEHISYVTITSPDHGPRILEYAQHRDVLDRAAQLLTARFTYAGQWSGRGFSGGAPISICFYNEAGRVLAQVGYRNGLIYVRSPLSKDFLLYRREDLLLDLSFLEEYAQQHGRFHR